MQGSYDIYSETDVHVHLRCRKMSRYIWNGSIVTAVELCWG